MLKYGYHNCDCAFSGDMFDVRAVKGRSWLFNPTMQLTKASTEVQSTLAHSSWNLRVCNGPCTKPKAKLRLLVKEQYMARKVR